MSDSKVKDFLQSIKNEPVKMFRIYDGSNRVQTQYEAITHAKDGDPCMRSDYVYDGASARVVQMKETVDLWDSAWDF